MSNTFTDLRDDILSRLTGAGLNAYGYVTPQIEAPLCLVLPGTPYVQPIEPATYCADDMSATFNFEIIVCASALDSETAIEELNQLVSDVLHALNGYAFVQVGKPGKMGDTPILGCIISISHVDSL